MCCTDLRQRVISNIFQISQIHSAQRPVANIRNGYELIRYHKADKRLLTLYYCLYTMHKVPNI